MRTQTNEGKGKQELVVMHTCLYSSSVSGIFMKLGHSGATASITFTIILDAVAWLTLAKLAMEV